MAKAILLTDTVLFGEYGNGRYMGAYAVASHARQNNHEVTVIDYFTRHPQFFEYLENFLDYDTQVLGLSSTFLAPMQKKKTYSQRSEGVLDFYSGELWFSTAEELQDWLKKLKELLRKKTKNAKLVLGGVKSQYAIWRPEVYTDFDYVFVGPSDRAFSKLLTHLENNETPPCRTLNGIQFFDNTFDIENKFCPVAHFTIQDAVQQGESLPLELARGCAFNCKFCHYNKQESLRKDLALLKAEMIRNYELFKTTSYSFCDDCFNDHPEKVKNYCEMFLSLPFKIEWVAYARVDVAVKFPWTLDLMIQSGGRAFYWGIESFDHEVARRAGKGTPPEKVKELLHRLHSEFHDQCINEISLITGLPGETHESLEKSLRWLVENPVADLISVGSLGLSPYVERLDKKVFDYADYSRNPEKYGFKEVRFKPDYWAHDTMNLDEAKTWATRIRSEYNAVKPYITARSIWLYPHLKTLGYSKEEIFVMFRGDPNPQENLSEIPKRFSRHLNQYWLDLELQRSLKNAVILANC